jgi:hypothetical protein
MPRAHNAAASVISSGSFSRDNDFETDVHCGQFKRSAVATVIGKSAIS